MDDTIRRALTGSPDRPTLTFDRSFRATAQQLRDACTDPVRLARWLGAVGGAPTQVGDAFTIDLGGPEDVAVCRVRTCTDHGISIDWSWPGEADSVVELRLHEIDDTTTRLTLQHSLGESPHAVDYGSGWEELLAGLARQLTPATSASSDETVVPGQWQALMRSPLVVERVLPVRPERVWAAFASAEGLASWWWTHWSDVVITADVRPGGPYTIEAATAGIILTGTYLTVDEPAHLAYTWSWRDADGEAPDEAVDIRFDPVPEGTRVIVRHTGPWADDAPAASYRQGWEYTLTQLETTVVAPASE